MVVESGGVTLKRKPTLVQNGCLVSSSSRGIADSNSSHANEDSHGPASALVRPTEVVVVKTVDGAISASLADGSGGSGNNDSDLGSGMGNIMAMVPRSKSRLLEIEMLKRKAKVAARQKAIEGDEKSNSGSAPSVPDKYGKLEIERVEVKNSNDALSPSRSEEKQPREKKQRGGSGRLLVWGSNELGQCGKSPSIVGPHQRGFGIGGSSSSASLSEANGREAKVVTCEEALLKIPSSTGLVMEGEKDNLPKILHLACGVSHNLAVVSGCFIGRGQSRGKTNGTGGFVSTRLLVWGNGSSGQLGNGSTRCAHRPVDIHFGKIALKEMEEHAKKSNNIGENEKEEHHGSESDDFEIAGVACGSKHSVVWTKKGLVYGFGCNFDAQLCYDYTIDLYKTSLLSPRLLGPLRSHFVVSVACTARATMFLTDDGTLLSCGHGAKGQLGHGDDSDQVSPKVVEYFIQENISIKAIACGQEHVLALTENGSVYAWGSREGCGSSKDETKPTLCQSLQRTCVSKIACGSHHCMVLTSLGRVFTWGSNKKGQLGLNCNPIKQEKSPVLARDRNHNKRPGSRASKINSRGSSANSIASLSSSSISSKSRKGSATRHTSANTKDNNVGIEITAKQTYPTFSAEPTLVEALKCSPIIDIGGGDSYSCAVQSNGTLWMWGENESCIIMNENSKQRMVEFAESTSNVDLSKKVFFTPVVVNFEDSVGVKSIVCGAWHVCAISGSPQKQVFKDDVLDEDCLEDEETCFRIKRKLPPIEKKKKTKGGRAKEVNAKGEKENSGGESKSNVVVIELPKSVKIESTSKGKAVPTEVKENSQVKAGNSEEVNPTINYDSIKDDLITWLKNTDGFDVRGNGTHMNKEKEPPQNDEEDVQSREMLKATIKDFIKAHYKGIGSKSLSKNIDRLLLGLDAQQIIRVSGGKGKNNTNFSKSQLSAPVATSGKTKSGPKTIHTPIRISASTVGCQRANTKEALLMEEIKAEEIEKERRRKEILIQSDERKKVMEMISSCAQNNCREQSSEQSRNESLSMTAGSNGDLCAGHGDSDVNAPPPSARIWEAPEYVTTEDGERILVRKFKGVGHLSGSDMEKRLICEYDEAEYDRNHKPDNDKKVEDVAERFLSAKTHAAIASTSTAAKSEPREEQSSMKKQNTENCAKNTQVIAKRGGKSGEKVQQQSPPIKRFVTKVVDINKATGKKKPKKKKLKRSFSSKINADKEEVNSKEEDQNQTTEEVFGELLGEIRDIKERHCNTESHEEVETSQNDNESDASSSSGSREDEDIKEGMKGSKDCAKKGVCVEENENEMDTLKEKCKQPPQPNVEQKKILTLRPKSVSSTLPRPDNTDESDEEDLPKPTRIPNIGSSAGARSKQQRRREYETATTASSRSKSRTSSRQKSTVKLNLSERYANDISETGMDIDAALELRRRCKTSLSMVRVNSSSTGGRNSANDLDCDYDQYGFLRHRSSYSRHHASTPSMLFGSQHHQSSRFSVSTPSLSATSSSGPSSSPQTITSKSKIRALDEGMRISKKRGKMHYKTTANIYNSPQPAVISTPVKSKYPSANARRNLPKWE
eukprot:Nk52_evm28s2391 gene=Nk52_evmTU28s2391